MTRGVTPYPELLNTQVLGYIKQGQRLPHPTYCPLDIYKVMLSCWSGDPDIRPNFDEVLTKIQSIVSKLENTLKIENVDKNKSNSYVNHYMFHFQNKTLYYQLTCN